MLALATNEAPPKPGGRLGDKIPTTLDEIPPGAIRAEIEASLRQFESQTPVLRAQHERVAIAAHYYALAAEEIARVDSVNHANMGVILHHIEKRYGRAAAEQIARELGSSVEMLSDTKRWGRLDRFEAVFKAARKRAGTAMAPIDFARHFKNFNWGPADRTIKLLLSIFGLFPSWLFLPYLARIFLLLVWLLMPQFNKNKTAKVRFRRWLWPEKFVTIDTILSPGIHPIRDDGCSMTVFVPYTYTDLVGIVKGETVYLPLQPTGANLPGTPERDFIVSRPVSPYDHLKWFLDWQDDVPSVGKPLLNPHYQGHEFWVNDQPVMVRVKVSQQRHGLIVRRITAQDSAEDQAYDGWLVTESIPWCYDPEMGVDFNVMTKGQIFGTAKEIPFRCQFSYTFGPFMARAVQAGSNLVKGIIGFLLTFFTKPMLLVSEAWETLQRATQIPGEIIAQVDSIHKLRSDILSNIAAVKPQAIELVERSEAEITASLKELALTNVASGYFTNLHIDDVVANSRELDRRLRKHYPDEREVRELSQVELEYAAIAHDVGKNVIPKEIVDAPMGAVLSDAQKEAMGFHVYATIDILLKALPEGEMKERIIAIAGGHHLTWDPTRVKGYGGYPTATAGPDTPLGARILQCIDVASAILLPRSYKPALSPEIAVMALLNGGISGQFDPLVALEAAAMYSERYGLRDHEKISERFIKLREIPEATRWARVSERGARTGEAQPPQTS